MSHYLVSGLEAAGLIVGLLGLLYMSYGVLGTAGADFVRPLLSALACAGSTLAAAWYLDSNLSMLLLGGPRTPGGDALLIGTSTVAAFVVAYALAFRLQHWKPQKDIRVLASRANAISLLAVELAAVGIYAASRLALDAMPLTWYESLVLAIPFQLIALLYLVALFGLGYLPKDRMQVIGLIMAVLGIIPQFISPVLDLLNIK